MAFDLRPLTIGELLDRAFTLYRRHIWVFVGIMVLPSVIAFASIVVMQTIQMGMQSAMQANLDAASSDPQLASQVIWLSVGYFGVFFVGGCAYFIVYTVALGATTLAVSELYVGRAVTIATAYARVRPYVGRLLLLMLLVTLRGLGLLILGGVLLGISGGLASVVTPILSVLLVGAGFVCMFGLFIYVMLRYSLSVPALVVEGVTARQSIARSIELVKGALWRILLLCVCAVVVTYAGAALLQGPFLVASFAAGFESRAGFALQLMGAVAGSIGQAFTSPIMIVGLALQYYDARIRHEAIDIDLMLAALDKPAAVGDAAGA